MPHFNAFCFIVLHDVTFFSKLKEGPPSATRLQLALLWWSGNDPQKHLQGMPATCLRKWYSQISQIRLNPHPHPQGEIFSSNNIHGSKYSVEAHQIALQLSKAHCLHVFGDKFSWLAQPPPETPYHQLLNIAFKFTITARKTVL